MTSVETCLNNAMTHDPLQTKRILLVDDEPELIDLLHTILESEGFTELASAHDVSSALQLCQDETFDLAILDVSLPDGDGFALCTFLRQLTSPKSLPVIFLTARDETADRLTGLRSGADDYITKPFSPQELILRIYAILRRCYPDATPYLELAHCRIDLENVEVIRDDGRSLYLTAKEHALVAVLSHNANRIVTTDRLCEECWGTSFGYEQTLMTHIRRIREKIEKDPSNPCSLITVKGLGYKLMVGKG